MNYDNIVNLIVEEIYKKLSDEKIKISNKSTIVTLFENDNSKFDLLKEDFDILGFDKSIIDAEIVVVSKLCMRGLSNLASGNSTSDEERFILKMLMKGKKVYVLDEGIEYKKYKETAPKALYKKYVSFEDEICKYGVEILKDINHLAKDKQSAKIELISNTKTKVESNIENKIISEVNSSNIEIDDELSLDLRNKKLISESDLKKPTLKGVKSVLISKRSIITPLATDFLRIHHLKLKRM